MAERAHPPRVGSRRPPGPRWTAGRLALAGLLSVVWLAGCGGQTATRAQVIARANAICQSTLDAIRAVAPPSSTSSADLGAYLGKVAPILDREATQIGRLPRPAARRTTLERFVSAVQAADRDYAAAASAARRGDTAAVDRAIGALRTTEVSDLARGYGMTVCAGAVATVR